MSRSSNQLAPGFVSPCQRPVPSAQDETLGSKASRVKSDRGQVRLRRGGRPGRPERAAEDRAGRSVSHCALNSNLGPKKFSVTTPEGCPGRHAGPGGGHRGGSASARKFARHPPRPARRAGRAERATVLKVTWITRVTSGPGAGSAAGGSRRWHPALRALGFPGEAETRPRRDRYMWHPAPSWGLPGRSPPGPQRVLPVAAMAASRSLPRRRRPCACPGAAPGTARAAGPPPRVRRPPRSP